jgi:hypothetical protein
VLAPIFKLCFRSSEPFAGVPDLDASGAAARRRPPPSARVAVAVAVGNSEVIGGLQVHHRTSERPGDAIHGLDPRDYQLAKLIDIARLGADDHVVGLVTSSASWTPSIPTISSATRAAY